MVIDDGRIIRLMELVVSCLEMVDQEQPHTMRAYLAELKEELQKTIADVTPR